MVPRGAAALQLDLGHCERLYGDSAGWEGAECLIPVVLVRLYRVCLNQATLLVSLVEEGGRWIGLCFTQFCRDPECRAQG